MVEACVEWSAHSAPVTAEDRAARLGQKPAAVSVSSQILAQAQAIESLLIQQGIVAIAKAGLDATQVALLRETGIVVISDVESGADAQLSADSIEELAEKIIALVRL